MRPAIIFCEQYLPYITLAGLLLACACTRSMGPSEIELGQSPYEPAYDPDGLLSNFERAWENMDLEAYRDLVLYDGIKVAADGGVYEPFIFYREDYPLIPTSFQGYEDEVANAARMFSGNPGRDGKVPGIASIQLEMLKRRDWTHFAGERVYGHEFPTGTQRCVFDCELFIELKDPYVSAGDAVNGFTVFRPQEFIVIPVQAVGATVEQPEYRLWKWRELSPQLRGVN